jgi:glycosyltransferase involved in cell wall biosynthesis
MLGVRSAEKPSNGELLSVSIAMATYNGESYVAQQLDSLIAQSYPVKEIVVCDDNSSDRTVEILDKYASDKIKVFKNEKNLGYIKNFQKACELCTGDVIALCDQDDIWVVSKLAVQLELMQANGYIAVFSDAVLVDADNLDVGQALWETVFKKSKMPQHIDYRSFYLANCVTGCTLIFRKELLASALPFCEATPHDWWLAYHAAFLQRLGYTREKLVRYRQHEGNTIGLSLKKKNGRKILEILKKKRKKYNLNLRIEKYIKWREASISRLKNMWLHEYSSEQSASAELCLIRRWFEGRVTAKEGLTYAEVFEGGDKNPVFAFTGKTRLAKSNYVGETVERGIKRIKRRMIYKHIILLIYLLATGSIFMLALDSLNNYLR